jgi:cysteinyl-tRNA synthetase
VGSFKDYGKLANRKLDEQQAGARVEVEPGKKHPFDFVLWKQAKPGEPSWPSPWGAGRPGWHIECSAMSCKHLQGDQETFDIHGGGMDLQFPHHECEIAQSEGAYDHKYVNQWMHVAFVNMAGEKMSKSLGNIMTVREALQKFDGRAIRLNMLMTHYRSPVDFSEESIRQAEAAIKRIDYCLGQAKQVLNIQKSIEELVVSVTADKDFSYSYREKVLAGFANDFDVSTCLREIFTTINSINSNLNSNKGSHISFVEELLWYLNVLGLLPKKWPEIFATDMPEGLQELLQEIDSARAAKDYAKADALKAQILDSFAGKVTITTDGAKWSKN